MSRILQVPSTDPAFDAETISRLTAHFNDWSGMDALRAADPAYTTPPFSTDAWRQHTTDTLWWVDYDAIYGNLGDAGRALADAHLADHPALEVVEVADLIAAGYLPPRGDHP